MAVATNYLGTEIGLIWDTLLPGVIPVTLCVAVQEGVPEDTAMVCCLCWFPTKHSGQLQLGQSQLSLSNSAFLLKCSVVLVHLLSQNQFSTSVQ